jgi:hypothetical protein
MKRLLSAVACLVTLNLVGCCCMSPRIDECGPFASDLAGGGGCLAKFARSHGAKKKCGCGHCGGGMYADPIYGMPYSGDCCGGGFDAGMMGGYPGMPSGGGCGCGGGGMVAPSMPAIPPAATQYAPEGSPTPAPTPDANVPETNIPAVPGAETPAPPAPPMTYQPAPGQPGVQNVSMEEFQRLPGTIISGPTTTPVAGPAASVPAIHSPVVTRTPIPTVANPCVRPANWQPARVQ